MTKKLSKTNKLAKELFIRLKKESQKTGIPVDELIHRALKQFALHDDSPEPDSSESAPKK
jgi:hypothetical protein